MTLKEELFKIFKNWGIIQSFTDHDLNEIFEEIIKVCKEENNDT